MRNEQQNENIDYMTDDDIRMIIKLIIQILKDDNVQEKTIKKIENLLDK
ncbi:hypothetical protein [Helcococcus kunzii]|nr:hypothetical protein [Helcococcus kunzii]